jgi:predicted NAD/FAD-binding protein
MNNLQGIDGDMPLFASLNPPFEPAEELPSAKYLCEHPQFNAAAFAAQKRLSEIQGRRHTWFCGAWNGYGFHEDGSQSGLPVAEPPRCGRPLAQFTTTDCKPGGVAMPPRAAQGRTLDARSRPQLSTSAM